jgi:PAS domain S-box-containing protein
MLDAFENAFATAPIGMALIDMAGHFLQVNDAFCRITGYKRGELILMLAQALPHPDDVVAELRNGKRCSTVTSQAISARSATSMPGVTRSGCW